MEPDQNHGNAPQTAEESTKSKTSYGLIGHVAKLIGKTVGLAQSSGTRAAEGIVTAGRQAGKLVHAPAKLRLLVTCRTEKEHKAEVDFEIERLGRRIEKLYARVGERICHSPLFDRSLLTMDPQLEALVSTVRDLEVEVNDLNHQDRVAAEESSSPAHKASKSAARRGPLCTRGSQASESNESAPSPPPREGEAQLSEAE